MTNLLRIDTSTGSSDSHSRSIANALEQIIRQSDPDITLIKRDLVDTDLPHVNQEFINAIFTPNEDRTENMKTTLSVSDQLIRELKSADTILLSTPMFNFTIPSRLKAYIDHISRVGETFSMDENGLKGLLMNKKLIITTSAGSEFTEMKQMDFLEPYLKSVFGFLGITDIDYLALEGSNMLTPGALNDKKYSLLHRFKESILNN